MTLTDSREARALLTELGHVQERREKWLRDLLRLPDREDRTPAQQGQAEWIHQQLMAVDAKADLLAGDLYSIGEVS